MNLGLGPCPLPRSAPETQGVSSARVLETLKALDKTVNEIHGVVISRNGVVISQSYPAPFAADFPHTCHSLGKSYTCTAIGIACTQGLVSPEDLIVDIMADEIKAYGITPDGNFKKMRLRDVMAMSNGMELMCPLNDTWIENWLNFPVKYDPGTYFNYNTVSACILGVIVEKVTGEPLLGYLEKNLFCHIGIHPEDLAWMKFTNGIYAEPGLSATTEANLKLGIFYLNKGFADGKQIIDPDWIKQATSKQIDSHDAPEIKDSFVGYGWQMWMCRKPGVVRFDGGQGQFCLIDTETNAVIAVHEGGIHPSGVAEVLTILQNLLYDMRNENLPEAPADEKALREYEQNRRLPDPEFGEVPAVAEKFNGVFMMTEGNANFWIEVFPGQADFYHLFYDPSVQWDMKNIEMRLKDKALEITVNNRSVFRVRLDGKYEVCDTLNVLPGLIKTAANGRFIDENTLHFTLRWLNSWMRWDVTLTLKGNDLDIVVLKDNLHENKGPLTRTGKAHRIAL